MKKLTIKSLITSMVVVSPLLFSLDVSAALDGKIYSGAECERHSGSTDYDRRYGMIRNLSKNKILTVMCPVTKDVFARSLNGGWMRLRDQNPMGNFRCVMHSKFRELDGSWVNSSSGNVYSEGDGPHTQKIEFSAVDLDHVAGGSNYYVMCKIPKKSDNGSSAIFSYSATEK